MAALSAIVRCNLAVIDGSYAAVGGLSTLRGGPGTCVLRALTVGGRTIPCGSGEITGRVVTRFGISVTQPSRKVAVPRSQPRLPTAHRRQLVGPGILAILSGLCAIFGSNFAVVNGPYSAVGSLSAPRVGPGTFVSHALTVTRRAIPCSSVTITGSVVTRFGLSVT